MSLNSNSSETFFSSEAPCAKLSFNINAFNGNKTNFNRCPAPKLRPVQPATKPIFGNNGSGSIGVGVVRPM